MFQQLYVIHAPLGSSYVSCVSALLAGKSQDQYKELLQAVVDKCCQLGYQPNPDVIMTDFELSVIRAASDVLGHHVQHRGCFYHLTQSTWHKVSNYFVLFNLMNMYKLLTN